MLQVLIPLFLALALYYWLSLALESLKDYLRRFRVARMRSPRDVHRHK